LFLMSEVRLYRMRGRLSVGLTTTCGAHNDIRDVEKIFQNMPFWHHKDMI